MAKLNHRRENDGRWSIFRVPVFIVHNRGSREVTTETLDQMIHATVKSPRVNGQSKITVRHPGFDASAVYGRASNYRRFGDVLFADFRNLRAPLFREISLDALPQWSIGLDRETMTIIEHIAFLGAEESYFPFTGISLDLSDEEKFQLSQDVEADNSFNKFNRETVPESCLYSFGNRGNMKLYTKDQDGNLVETTVYKEDGTEYEIQPEDAAEIVSIVQEQTASLRESVGMLQAEMASIKAEEENEDDVDKDLNSSREDPEDQTDENVDQGASEETEFAKSEEDEEEKKDAKSEDDGDDDEDEEDSKKSEKSEDEEDDEDEDEKKDDESKSSRDDDVRQEILLEQENAKLKTELDKKETFEKLAKAIDSRIYVDQPRLVEQAMKRIYEAPSEKREAILETYLDVYKESGVPTGELDQGDDEPLDQEAKFARSKFELLKKTGEGSYVGFHTEEALAEYLRKHPKVFEQME